MELWTLITSITEDDDGRYLVFHTPHGNFHVRNNGSITRINKPGGPTPEKPWGKFFRYEPINAEGRQLITYIENRTVDIIPVSHDFKYVYLITRKTKNGIEGGLAIPGGHIDPPETPEDAAYRELTEETLAWFGLGEDRRAVKTMTCLETWVPEVVAPGKEPAEHISMTLPFVAVMVENAPMCAGDDAADGSWFDIKALPWDQFHFLHHVDILKNWLKTI